MGGGKEIYGTYEGHQIGVTVTVRSGKYAGKTGKILSRLPGNKADVLMSDGKKIIRHLFGLELELTTDTDKG